MDPGLFILFTMGGFFVASVFKGQDDAAAACACPSTGQPRGPSVPQHPLVAKAEQIFLPATAAEISIVRTQNPAAPSSWKTMAAKMPFLTEAVAMFYTMIDPRTPLAPKLTIAGALIYTVSPDPIPGPVDDTAVLLVALGSVYSSITEEHLEMAQAWLRSQGVDPKPLFNIGKDFSVEATAGARVPEIVHPVNSPRAFLPGPVGETFGRRGKKRRRTHNSQPAAPFRGW